MSPGAKPWPPMSPAEGLKKSLEEKQAELDKLTKTKEALKADLAIIEKAENEGDQAVKAYEQKLPALEKDKQQTQESLDRKLPLLEAAIGPNKRAVDKVIEDDDRETEAMETDVKTSGEEVKAAEESYAAATAGMNKAQAEANATKTTLGEQTARVTSALKEAADLGSKLEKEDPDRPANLYFLAMEMKALLDETELKSVDWLKGEFSRALKSMDDASRAAREAKADLDTKKLAWESRRATLLTRQTQRRERIMKLLRPYNAVAAWVPSSSGRPGGSNPAVDSFRS